MITLIILGVVAWFAYRYLARKKHEVNLRNRTVDFRNTQIRPITRRLPWKELP